MVLLSYFTLLFALLETSFQDKLLVKISEVLMKSTTSYSLSVLNIDRSRECIDILENLYRFTTVLYATNLTVRVHNHPWDLKYFTPSTKVNIWCNYKVGQEFAVLRTVKVKNKTVSKPVTNIVDPTRSESSNQKKPAKGQSLIDVYRGFLNEYGIERVLIDSGKGGILQSVLFSENSTISDSENRNNIEDETGGFIYSNSSNNTNQTGLYFFPAVERAKIANETYLPINQTICKTGPDKKTICRNNPIFSDPDAAYKKSLNLSKYSRIPDLNRKKIARGVSESSLACFVEVNVTSNILNLVREQSGYDNLYLKEFYDQSPPDANQTLPNVRTSSLNSNPILGITSVSDSENDQNETIFVSYSNNEILILDDVPPNGPASGMIINTFEELTPVQKLNQSQNYTDPKLSYLLGKEVNEGMDERNIHLQANPTLNYTHLRLVSKNNKTETMPEENSASVSSGNVINTGKDEADSKLNSNLNKTNPRVANSSGNGLSKNSNETEAIAKEKSKSSDFVGNGTTKVKNKTSTSSMATNLNLNYTNPRLGNSTNKIAGNRTKSRNQTDDDTSEFDIQFIEKSAMGLNPRFYYILLVDFADDVLENHLRMLWKKYKIFRFIVIAKSNPDSVYYFSPYPECDVGGRLKKFKGANLDVLPDIIEKTVWNLHKCKMGVVIYSRVPTAIPVDKNNQFNDTEGSKFIGQDGMFMNTLIERMNFTPVKFTPRGVRMEYGIKKVKGNFTGTFFPILNGNAELCSNGHFVKDYQDKRVDFVKPITLDYVSIMAPKASVIPPVITVLLSFELSVWVMLTLTFFSTVFIYVLYLKYAISGHLEHSFWISNRRPIEQRHSEQTFRSPIGRMPNSKYPISTFQSPADRLALSTYPRHSRLSFSNRFPMLGNSTREFWSPADGMTASKHLQKTLWFSGGRSVEPPSGVDIPVVFFDTFRFFISSPPPKCLIVDSNFERILIASILVFTIVITSSFQGNLVRFLSVPVYYPDIDTLKQLEESSLLIWTSSLSWRDIFYSDPILWGLASKVHRWKSEQDMHDSDGNYAGFQRINVHSYKYFKDVILTGLKNNATRKLHTLSQNLITYYLAYIVIKDSPYRTRIDSLISRMEAAGLVTKWSSDVIKYTLETYRTVEERRIKKKKKVFTVADLSAAFIVLAVGAVISAVALFFEVLVEYYRFTYKFKNVIIPSKRSGANDDQVLELKAKEREPTVPDKPGLEFCP